MGVVAKALNLLRRRGPAATVSMGIGFVYNRTVRRLLPETEEWVRYNGVKLSRRRVGDARMPFPTQGSDLEVDYEVALGRAIRDHVGAGDAVLEVAGGFGVTATIAARRVGPTGSVTTVEGSPDLADEARATVERNDVADRVQVCNRVVGESAGSVRGAPDAPGDPLAVEDLPAADVLVIDCDGCEFALVDALDAVDPDRVIVEHHAVLDVEPPVEYEPDRVRAAVEAEGYAIADTYTRRMDADIPEFGDEETVFVGVRQP